jgi:hypothetical protein
LIIESAEAGIRRIGIAQWDLYFYLLSNEAEVEGCMTFELKPGEPFNQEMADRFVWRNREMLFQIGEFCERVAKPRDPKGFLHVPKALDSPSETETGPRSGSLTIRFARRSPALTSALPYIVHRGGTQQARGDSKRSKRHPGVVESARALFSHPLICMVDVK